MVDLDALRIFQLRKDSNVGIPLRPELPRIDKFKKSGNFVKFYVHS